MTNEEKMADKIQDAVDNGKEEELYKIAEEYTIMMDGRELTYDEKVKVIELTVEAMKKKPLN